MLTDDLASQSGPLQFAVTFLKDNLFKAVKLVGRGDVTDRGMQSNRVSKKGSFYFFEKVE